MATMNNTTAMMDLLKLRRTQAIYQAEKKKTAIWRQIPRLAAIDQEIAAAGIRLFEDQIQGKTNAQEVYDAQIHQLENEKIRIFKENEILPEALKPQFQCMDCEDTGYVDGETCHCLKKMTAECFFSAFDLTPAAKACNFDRFDLDVFPEEYKARARKTRIFGQQYCAGFIEEGNYIFIGKAGRGKTFLSSCIAVELLNQGWHVIYITAAHLADLVRDYVSSDRKTEAPLLYQALNDCDLLIIDDFGAEYQTDFAHSALYDIIDSRLLKNKKMIISTNLDINEIAAQYNVRLSSRLRGNFKQLTFPWGDIRVKKYKGNAD